MWGGPVYLFVAFGAGIISSRTSMLAALKASSDARSQLLLLLEHSQAQRIGRAPHSRARAASHHAKSHPRQI
jgi:hypothetical protein